MPMRNDPSGDRGLAYIAMIGFLLFVLASLLLGGIVWAFSGWWIAGAISGAIPIVGLFLWFNR